MLRKSFFLALLALPLLLISCTKDLELNPKASVSKAALLDEAGNAQSALNGVYRALYTINSMTFGPDWNVQQNIGYRGFSLVGDLMGTDMYWPRVGNGWYFADYALTSYQRSTHSASRCYEFWKFNYKVISNLNVIIGALPEMKGSAEELASVKGQAYALRATAYHHLALAFCHHIQYKPDAPGVPIYVDPTGSTTQGKPRGTVKQVWDQITEDIKTAVEALATVKDAKTLVTKERIIIDYLRARAIQAQIYLDLGEYATAKECADEVLTKYDILKSTDVTKENYTDKDGKVFGNAYQSLGKGFASADVPSVVWGAQVLEKQTDAYGGLWSHFDPRGAYAMRAPKCIHPSLYNFISSNDLRKQWWYPFDGKNVKEGLPYDGMVVKYRASNLGAGVGDIPYIRAEEMLLISAECACRLNDDATAQTLLKKLITQRIDPAKSAAERDAVLEAYGCNLTGTDLLSDRPYPEAAQLPKSLLDAILIQRRIELWGEGARFFHMKRLNEKLKKDDPYFKKCNVSKDFDPGTDDWCFSIPTDESDYNKNL